MKPRTRIAGWKVAVCVLLCASSPLDAKSKKKDAGPPDSAVVVELLGIKVQSSSSQSEYGQTLYKLEIVAVLEDGPAFFAMLQPGDRITQARGMRAGEAEAFASHIGRSVKPGEVVGVDYEYTLADGRVDRFNRAEVFAAAGLTGRWITTRLAHTAEAPHDLRTKLPGVAEARTAAAARYAEMHAQARRELDANPCAVTEPVVLAVVKRLEPSAKQAGIEIGSLDFDLFHGARRACANATEGGLPDFEATVIAMMRGKLDACAHESAANHQSALAAARAETPRTDYAFQVVSYAARLSSPLRSTGPGRPTPDEVRAHEARNACLLKFIENRLLNGGAAGAPR